MLSVCSCQDDLIPHAMHIQTYIAPRRFADDRSSSTTPEKNECAGRADCRRGVHEMVRHDAGQDRRDERAVWPTRLYGALRWNLPRQHGGRTLSPVLDPLLAIFSNARDPSASGGLAGPATAVQLLSLLLLAYTL